MSYFYNLKISPSSITEQAVAGILAGLSAAILLKFFTWIVRPKLKLYFKESDTYGIIPNQDNQTILFTHLGVKNVRRAVAVGCRVFLLKIEKKNNNKFENLPLKIFHVLKWSNENEPKGYEGLEIPGYYRRRVDLAAAELGSTSNFALFIEGGLRGISNSYSNGEYRFTIQATGSNTNTITKRFTFKWCGSFIKSNIVIKEDNFFERMWFKIINIFYLIYV